MIIPRYLSIWFNSKSRNYLASPASGDSFTVSRGPLRRIPTIQVNNIYPDPDGKTVWFASHDGLIRCDTTIKKNCRQDYRTLVRKVSINKKVIFNGYKNKTSNTAEELIPVIRYNDRNLRFDFDATFLEAETNTLYRCLLEGYDDGWSSWDKETIKAYTNLSPGFYTFRVQSKNVYQHIGAEDRFRFRILPPWYMTWWAYCLYALGIILVIYGIVKWRSFKLVLEKQNLENIIKERMKEIKQKNQQLEIQSNQLQEMAKVKSHFFANISHEFRTPLTLIMNPLEQMLTDSRSKKQKKMLKSMLQNSQRLLTLINQLLDLSRFDSGKTKLQAAFQNIVPFIRGILASFQMLARQNQLSLDFHAEKQEIALYYDTQKMEEVMYNLLINAIKFTPPGGKITVSISLACGEGEEQHPSPAEETVGPSFVEISVRDTGIGISTEQLDHILDRFYQAESHRDIKGHKGTGIGLALTREMVLLHRGRIDVHSREGKGSEFVIRLPLGQSHLDSHEVKLRSQTVTFGKKEKEIQLLYMTEESEVEDETTVESSLDENGNNGAETGADAGGTHKKKSGKQEKNVILVVEDNADVRKYIREPLEKNYKVVEAGDGKEGIEKAKKIIPDLIVSDIMMPEPDGIELCKVLKKDIETSHIPIILLTAKASEESIIRGLKTGADDYITKPFKTRILLARIKNLIYLRHQMQLKIQRRKLLLPAEISISSADEKFLKEFREIVEKNFTDQEFNVDMLCKKLFMGRATIFRKTQALTGETPNQYILSCRLERGAQLLENNYGNVTEVALAVGFYNPSYFSKCFKEKFHRSPSSFKTSESQSPAK